MFDVWLDLTRLVRLRLLHLCSAGGMAAHGAGQQPRPPPSQLHRRPALRQAAPRHHQSLHPGRLGPVQHSSQVGGVPGRPIVLSLYNPYKVRS